MEVPIPRHTISVLVENKFGVLARVAGMFSGRGYNIHSLNVGPSHDPAISRMTIVVREKELVLDQIIKQLDKLVDVIQVIDFRDGQSTNRELVLVHLKASGSVRSEIIELCTIFSAAIVDVSNDEIVVEMNGSGDDVAHFVSLLAKFDILNLTRTGKIALPRLLS